jgi:hypothetical protein
MTSPVKTKSSRRQLPPDVISAATTAFTTVTTLPPERVRNLLDDSVTFRQFVAAIFNRHLTQLPCEAYHAAMEPLREVIRGDDSYHDVIRAARPPFTCRPFDSLEHELNRNLHPLAVAQLARAASTPAPEVER